MGCGKPEEGGTGRSRLEANHTVFKVYFQDILSNEHVPTGTLAVVFDLTVVFVKRAEGRAQRIYDRTEFRVRTIRYPGPGNLSLKDTPMMVTEGKTLNDFVRVAISLLSFKCAMELAENIVGVWLGCRLEYTDTT